MKGLVRTLFLAGAIVALTPFLANGSIPTPKCRVNSNARNFLYGAELLMNNQYKILHNNCGEPFVVPDFGDTQFEEILHHEFKRRTLIEGDFNRNYVIDESEARDLFSQEELRILKEKGYKPNMNMCPNVYEPNDNY